MTTPTPINRQSQTSKEDVLTKYGNNIVVIIFCLLSCETLPAIIQNGLDPDKLFAAIVLVTLPYTAAAVLVVLLWMYTGIDTFQDFCMCLGCSGLILFGFCWLASIVHLGISEHEFAFLHLRAPHMTGSPIVWAVQGALYSFALIQFYLAKYGLPMFISATVASFIIAWRIKKSIKEWMEK